MRSYDLPLYPNTGKMEAIRYAASFYKKYLQSSVTYFYYHRDSESRSTEGMGLLCNQAQQQARGIVNAVVELEKEIGKSNCPQIKMDTLPATLEISKDSSFSYWASIPNSITGSKKPYKIPAKSYRKVKQSIKNGWELSKHCEIRIKHGKPYARIYLKKEQIKAEPIPECLGVDVGYRTGVSRSDRYRGKSIKAINTKAKKKRIARQKQGIKSKVQKTSIKQLLDIEAKRVVARCKALEWSLAIESSKVVGNLGRRNLHGWAAAYFGRRASTIAKEEGVWVVEVNPAYTSRTCSRCGKVEEQSRKGFKFHCIHCGYQDHADINGARIISKRGTESICRYITYKNSRRAVGPRK
jgi:predicted RNA-binding Zn-ribbon protein involved in translation (DUF1610 family)